MDLHLESPVASFLSRSLLIALSFSDDAAIFVLSRLGFHLQWLQWLSPVMLSITVLGWGIRMLRHSQSVQKVFAACRE